ncbi:YHYH protein [Marinobacter sp. F3R08]|uniref:YHYH protein n=1 Tax=Marinobacter sp. F3R08 TaxID=2841559 RepID=UPI001C08F05C|nr:YHYH protein [Marinobacter sp. F3R08]MBU2952682.1 YHYH protein [Marinobacter sp. F3R08]
MTHPFMEKKLLHKAGISILLVSLAACGGDNSSSDDSISDDSSSDDSSLISDGGDVSTTPGSTSGVLCDYDDTTYNSQTSLTYTSYSVWTCTDSTRELSANGIPDHEVGTFPNPGNPNVISEQTVSASYTLEPEETTTPTELGGPRGATGYVLNGVKIDASTAGSCDDSGSTCSLIDNSGNWNIEALGQTSFDFGTDQNNAHVQPDGAYHYHGMPEGFITKRGGNSSVMTLIGWAADGFPIYARYGYSVADDASSEVRAMTGSYQLVSEVSASRPSTDTYALGTFQQDWEYVEGSGDLDECNGRVGVTPEFPDGIYHYYATDSYPYFQRCVKGEVATSGELAPPPAF